MVLVLFGLSITACAPGPGASGFWGGFWEGYNESAGNTSPYTYGAVESRITSDFDGLDRGNVYLLANGQVWEQTEYYYWYWYAYRPKVVIYSSYGVHKMVVEGIGHSVTVRQLR